METIILNELYVVLIALGVTLFPFLIAGHHYKKYGIIQAIFSLICLPMIFCGFSELALFIFESNAEVSMFIHEIIFGLENYFSLNQTLFSMTGWKWLYTTGWIFMPYALVFILTYGYSITRYQKKKRKKD